MTTTTK